MRGLSKTVFIHFIIIAVFLTLSACATTVETPPPTLQAVVDNSELLAAVNPEQVEVLQDTGFGSGKILLYRWQAQDGAYCLGSSYIINVNNNWQSSNTATMPCQFDPDLMAAYTGNSQIESELGVPRETIVYGYANRGHAVQIVWNDGQVDRIPLENNSFLGVRSGRYIVERIELVDQNNALIQIEDWSTAEPLPTT